MADPQRRWTPRSGWVEVKDSTITVNYGVDGLTKGRYVPAEVAERLAASIEPLLGTMNFYFGPGARSLASSANVGQYREVVAALAEFRSLSSPADSQEQGNG